MLTPVDIENKEFKKARFGGYKVDDVEDFLEKIIVDYELLFKENKDLNDRLALAEESQNYYNSLEEGVSKTIENTNRAAEEIKKTAIEEADKIKEDAEKNSLHALEEIKLEIKSKEIELEQVKKQMQIYKIKVGSMLEAQLKILNEED